MLAKAKELWRRLGKGGTEGLGREEQRKIVALNQFVLIAVVSVASYGVSMLFVDARQFLAVVLVDAVAAALHLTEFVWIRRRRHGLAVAQFLLVCNAQLAVASYLSGPAFGFHYYFFAFATVVFLVVPRKMWWLYPFSVVSTAAFVYFSFAMDPGDASIRVSAVVETVYRLVTVIATGGTLGLIAFLFDDDARDAEEELAVEHDRSERLLLNILPRTISERLKGGQHSIADGFADVSVLFADIVGFTELSARLPPAELVGALNQVFSKFDELADKHGLEKIKTIGDAYMVASGLPVPRADHAVAATHMALDMRDALVELNARHGLSLEARIGIHSGPVVAGVIGKKKFIYDLWGDTVNTASRMESHGVKGAVHVSESTAKLIEDAFVIEARGAIAVKGKGEMQTFLVVAARGASAAAGP